MALQWDVILAFVLIVSLISAVQSRSRKSSAPVLTSDWFFGYPTALKMFTQYRPMLVEGYAKFNKHAFQVPGIKGWIVFVGRELYDDVRKARDDSLSMPEQVKDTVALEYTIDRAVALDPWHNSVVRKQMTQALGAKFPEIYDEITSAFQDELKLSGKEWKPVYAHDLIIHIVCRASNRLFVGLPLCRDPVYTQISRDFSGTVMFSGFLINLFPTFLKPLVGRWITAAPRARKGFEKFLVPMIKDRWRKEQEMGELWEKDKPSDLLQWVMDASKEHDSTPEDITNRLLGVNFAATHTTSLSFTHVVYWLAARPECASILREDVDEAVAKHGWTKTALGEMHKIDSFIKESLRVTGIGATAMGRKAMKDLTLSDGTFVPKGASVVMNLWGIHHDPTIFPKPLEFDPLRYSRRIEAGESEAGNSLATASGEFLFWGGGSHVCAGRHFASQEMKTMLAVIVSLYEVKFEGLADGVRPKDRWMAYSCIPDMKQRVMFRLRE
ncbi:cytochrome P450 [Dacryopinax primogenitus]|uniref:Cytochrome P450 n=1 Tax=Dacryopinax primogenitus (strain DJM 731) TaxID=1858805 RepID=M5FPN6_DACPD|nr:cytochrome P450 [Dacryopinax primogenitus]EJT96539.1 cytochrome P450 [Dacryopinax primogenitus]